MGDPPDPIDPARDIADAAHAGDRHRMRRAAIALARTGADPDLADTVAAFSDARWRVLGAVARALTHHRTVIQTERFGLIDAHLLADIAGDGARWREARLEALWGADYEAEHLALRAKDALRSFPDGPGRVGGGMFAIRTAEGYRNLLAHRIGVRLRAGAPATMCLSLPDAAAASLAAEALVPLGGRLRTLALRIARPEAQLWHVGYELRYEGRISPSADELRVVLRVAPHSTADPDPAAARAIIERSPLLTIPRPEPGLWGADGDDAPARPLIGVREPGPAPAATLDALLGERQVCAHRRVRWRGGQRVMVSAICERCADEVLRWPRTGVDAMMPGPEVERRRVAEEHLSYIQALACLMGDPVPADADALLGAPRADDWRRALSRLRASRRAARPRTHGALGRILTERARALSGA